MQRVRVSLILLVICALVVGASSVGASPDPGAAQRPLADMLGGGFTYQGQLKRSGSPVSGACDFRFTLWDAATSGSQIGPLVSRLSLPVSGGVFTAEDLDFGAAAFDGDARWLEISVMCTGDSDFVVLSPRQGIAAAPYALFAPEAGTAASAPWSGLTDVPAGFADDVDDEGAGTVTSVATGTGLTGGPITTSGTIGLAAGGVTTSHIADGTILMEDLADGASLAEILDDDGHSSGLDADLIDGHQYSELATATHSHSALDAADGSPTNAIVVTADGRTGIGTTSPGVTLEIGSLASGESKPTVFVAGSIIDRTFTGSTPDAPAFATYNYPAYSTRYGIGQVTGGLGLIGFEGPGVGNFGNIQFFTGNLNSGFPSAERMRIGYNGYVGIGTTSPGQMLDVVGGNVRTNGQFISTVVTGTAPLVVASTTLVTNLNADLLDGQSAAYYQRAVGGSCAAGSAIRVIGVDGSVTCETDDNTTYTNGAGIQLSANQFSANFTSAGGENGSATTVARGDHTHDSDYVNTGEALSISSGMIVADAVSTSQIVNGTLTFADWASNGCGSSQIPRWNGSAWSCVTDSTGTVTSVGTGSGLSGGPITTTGTISIATGGVTSTHILDNTISPSDIADGATLNEISDDDGIGSGLDADLLDGAQGSAYQLRVGSTCSPGSSIRAIDASGGVTCETDDAGTGTVTSVGTASGLSGGPITTTGTIGIATSGVTSSHILDATVTYLDLQDTAALAEISDDDGVGSGLDADLLDGLQGSAYAPASHAHSALNASDGSPTNAVYLDTEGHVGIGTTSPGADTLSVVGGVRVNGLLTLPFVINTTVDGLAPGAYVDIPIETVTGLAFYNATTYNSYWATNTKLRAWVWAEALDVSGSGNQNKYWVRVENIGTVTASAYDSVLVIKMAGFTP